jgi:hypothetical protein
MNIQTITEFMYEYSYHNTYAKCLEMSIHTETKCLGMNFYTGTLMQSVLV